MLQICYLGIAFAVVFYVVFGITVRIMELTDQERNKARLLILITSLSMTTLSSFFAGLINLNSAKILLGVPFILLSIAAFAILAAILFELHHIQTKRKMRKFMVLFDIVDKFINEGKTREEILHYLIEIQKLTKREAMDFLEFISDPQNYQFLQDVNEKIHEAQLLKGVRK
ncbi:MAG: hypothetical protein II842_17120 [Butyrivibrio sp.]|nr:hypothetical protein [Butyrivibrio sp.]